MRIRRGGVSVLVLCAAIATTAAAQKSTNFGVLAGGSFAKFRGDDVGNFDHTKVGIAAGVFVTAGLTPQFAVEPELLYVMKGGKNDVDDQEIKVSYIAIPVLLKLRIPAKGNGSQFSPHLYGGGAIGFKAGCHQTVTPAGGSTTSMSCEDAGSKLKSTDISVVFGGGVDVGRAIIDARYDLGVSKIDDSASQLDIKNRTFYLLVGWTFRAPR